MESAFQIHENKSLKDLSTFGIGGLCKFFTEAKTENEMRESFFFAKKKQIPFLVLGKGSNCLFDDRGFNGLVILNKIDYCKYSELKVEVGAGYSFSLLGVQTAKKGWSGLEFASGIPASVGGAVYMNAGANQTETVEALNSVLYMHDNGEIEAFDKKDLQFGYRFSSFQNMKGAIIGATFVFTFSSHARNHQIEIIGYRTRTQPYSDKSAGCIFRNPSTLSAGALIEKSGLKGYQFGGAAVSNKHANFLINKESASSEDIKELIRIVKRQVKTQMGVDLDVEIKIISPDGC
ncbi:MAG: UDP-N-acetylmuramate dehydrogenase [Rhabdochlamydiaceae bacterium]